MDITLVGIPEGITEQEVKEWVSILVQRKEEQKLTPPVEVVKASKTTIDSFREANALEARFPVEEKTAVVEEVVEPIVK